MKHFLGRLLARLGRRCGHCGKPIRREATSSTGWTHWPGDPAIGWQGVRCPGLLVGASP